MKPSRMRLTVRRTMIAVVVIAVGCAALRSSTYLWLRAVNTLVVGVLLVAPLAARYGRAADRAFWLGFAVFGWGYYSFACGPWDVWRTSDDGGNLPYTEVHPNLLSTDAVRFVVARTTKLPEPIDIPQGSLHSPEFVEKAVCAPWIGHLLVTLVIGWVGGTVSRHLHSSERRNE
jgi:hypothetical protein